MKAKSQKIFALLVFVTLLTSCGTVSSTWFVVDPANKKKPVDNTTLTVVESFKYSPTLTSFVFPAGEYIPVKKDSDGTYYESARGVNVQPIGSSYVVEGGIFRKNDKSAKYEFCIYYELPPFGMDKKDLHSMLNLDLNTKIKCNPPHNFK